MSADNESDGYASFPLMWKARKVARYSRLYGVRRTLVKVRAQQHMASTSVPGSRWINKEVDASQSTRTVALVGCGKFAYSVAGYYLSKLEPNFLKVAMDIDLGRARSLTETYKGALATTQFGDILRDDQIDLVFVQSNHASHAEYAVACLDAGKAVHIEKPHAVTRVQLQRLEEAMRRNPEVPVFLGFNRPRSRHFEAVKQALDSQTGPAMVNWFIAGHAIPAGHWYFSEDEGGRVLGNLCHWLDMSLRLVGMEKFFPCLLVPGSDPGSRSDFALTTRCADSSLVTLSFSAKGHGFEGVREVLNVHRGEMLAQLKDFESSTIEIGAARRSVRTLFREHGHEANISNSYLSRSRNNGSRGEGLSYVRGSGLLAIAAREALSSGESVVLDASDIGIVG